MATLQEYIGELERVLKENPDAAEWLVVYSSDDEGNHFQEVSYIPTTGCYDDGEFSHDEELNICFNAVCLN